MECYDWNVSQSRKSLEAMFGKPYEEIPNSATYVDAVDKLMNEGMQTTKRNTVAKWRL